MHPRLFAGVLVAIAGLALAFVESLDLGSDDLAWAGAAGAAALAARARRRATCRSSCAPRELDAVVLNGWAMLGGGLLLLAVSGGRRELGRVRLDRASRSGRSPTWRSSGSAIAFVVLTVLLRHISARATSFLAMLLPFGALAFGAALYDEPVTARAAGGRRRWWPPGLMIAQGRGLRRRDARAAPRPPADR